MDRKGTIMNFQKTGKRTKSQPIKQIPQDIIEDILVNLPVKSLLRFKCVSKPWRCLISSKHFTKEHLHKSRDSISRHSLIYCSDEYDFIHNIMPCPRGGGCGRSLRSCSLKSFLDDQNYEDNSMVTTSYHDSFLPNQGCLGDIVGSCNGLILITSKIAPRWSDLILWNPSTRQVKIIPPPPFARRKRYRYSDRFEYGFGYDDSTDDYMVVSIFVSYPGPYKTRMYSLRTNSWKKIGDFEKGYPWGCSDAHVNGKLHWLAAEAEDGGNENIVSLSLVDAKYDIVAPPPHYLEYDPDSFCNLGDLRGYLSLIYDDDILLLSA